MGRLSRFGLFDVGSTREPAMKIKTEPSLAEDKVSTDINGHYSSVVENGEPRHGSVPSQLRYSSPPIRTRPQHSGDNHSALCISDMSAAGSGGSSGLRSNKRLRSSSPQQTLPPSHAAEPLSRAARVTPESLAYEAPGTASDAYMNMTHQRHSKAVLSRRAEPAEENSSGSESDKIESVIETIMTNAADNVQARISRLRGVYDRNRRLHRKYRRLAEMASDEMHSATRAIFQLLEAQGEAPSGSLPANAYREPVERAADEYANTDSTRARDMPRNTRPVDPLSRTAPVSIEKSFFRTNATATLQGSGSKGNNGSDDSDSDSDSDSKEDEGVALVGDLGLRSRPTAVHPYQFNTQLQSAFKRKPREAFVCTLPGMQQQAILAYGLDGSVQFWDPQEQTRIKYLDDDYFDIEFAQQIIQVSPSAFALVPRSSRHMPAEPTKTEPLFLGVAASSRHNKITTLPVQRWQDITFNGADAGADRSVSVIQSMTLNGGASSDGCEKAFMLSGRTSQKSVVLQSLRIEHGKVRRIDDLLSIKLELKSRISALCHASWRDHVITATCTGRVYANDVQSGRLVSGFLSLGCTVGSISPNPANGNLLMMGCGSNSDQIRIFDLRSNMAKEGPALCLGRKTPRTQSEYIRPAWHPSGSLVFCPFHRNQDGDASDNLVAIWDTRYAKCDKESPQIFRPHKTPTWSVAFVDSVKSGGAPLMVTAGGDHNIGFTTFKL